MTEQNSNESSTPNSPPTAKGKRRIDFPTLEIETQADGILELVAFAEKGNGIAPDVAKQLREMAGRIKAAAEQMTDEIAAARSYASIAVPVTVAQ